MAPAQSQIQIKINLCNLLTFFFRKTNNIPMKKTKGKTKTEYRRLIRSDKNLLAFGLFGAALLIGVFLFLDNLIHKPTYVVPQESERTIRVESVPARLNSTTDFTNPEDLNAQGYSEDQYSNPEAGY
jgi:hypothetical protein